MGNVNTTYVVLSGQLRQELLKSIIVLDLYTQTSTADIPQAQGISVPIFGENCPGTQQA